MFNNYVALYVPTVRAAGGANPIPSRELEIWQQKVETTFSNLFGGCTGCWCRGCWIDETGKLVREEVYVVHSYATEQAFKDGQSEVRDLARKLAFALCQSCIAVVFNDEMVFVTSA